MTMAPRVRWVATPVQTLVWTFDINGADGSPSLSKILAFMFGITAARDAWRNGFDTANVAAMGLIISAALGRSVWMNWLNRNTFTNAMTASASTSVDTNVTLTGDLAKIAEVVGKRRDAERGVEPAP